MTSEFSLLEVLAFQPFLAWPWLVVGGGLGVAVWRSSSGEEPARASALLALLWLGMGSLTAVTAAAVLPGAGPSDGLPAQCGASPLERGWSLDIPEEP